MADVMDKLGSIAGVAGLIVCLLTGLMRLGDSFYLGPVPLETIFLAGGALMVAACYFKLEALSLRGRAARAAP